MTGDAQRRPTAPTNLREARWRPSGFLGVVHLIAMPGDPEYLGGGFAKVREHALRDAHALVDGGVDALIIENFGSAPFATGGPGQRLRPHEVALLTLVASACKAKFDVAVGVNCLRNDALSAMGIAAAAELEFIRVNVHVGAYLTDQGIIEGEAHASMRYRAALQAQRVAVLADVFVKHATPLAALDPVEHTHDVVRRGKADAVIVTGAATGAAISPEHLATIDRAASDTPVLLGSGVTPAGIVALGPHADGAIVGSWLKVDGQVSRPVDLERVRAMRAALDQHLRGVAPRA